MSYAPGISVTGVMSQVVNEAGRIYGKPLNFLWGDWTYIANQLELWSKAPGTAARKYPVVCLFLPYDEERTDRRYASKTNVDLLIATPTRSGYTNEQREEKSFKAVLRPIYAALIEALRKSPLLDFERSHVPHTYSENYGYGSRGVMMSQDKKFTDLIDGIDIKQMQLKIKKQNCYGRRL